MYTACPVPWLAHSPASVAYRPLFLFNINLRPVFLSTNVLIFFNTPSPLKLDLVKDYRMGGGGGGLPLSPVGPPSWHFRS